MTLADRKRFMRELAANVLKDALAQAKQMPEEWDGHELRRFLADKFEDASITLRASTRDTGYKRRWRAYRNDVLTRGL